MNYIDPHVHMSVRTTTDYEAMAQTGCVAVTEPSFWPGYDRGSAEAFSDYFKQLTETEPARANKFGIDHFCWICINPKEAEDPVLAREVVSMMPDFLAHPKALGIGEIGLNKNTRNEMEAMEAQIKLALDHDTLILVHTPHLEDKLKGARLTIDALKNQRFPSERVIIDHCEEHTIELALDAGMWAGITLYPNTKCSVSRAVDIWEMYGDTNRIWMNSAADWGVSDPLAVPKTLCEMKRRGHSDEEVHDYGFESPIRFLAQSAEFQHQRYLCKR